ncbi:GH23104 [Drosophila grimshawi]|uniref:GH23104 n=1 Tax=Drosophila grimshawi TaxID=7222 RepID=B4JTH7_DROGR|nr:GH23104 [Drosophila grimshawi]
MQNGFVANAAVLCKMVVPANATLNLIINYRAGNGVYSQMEKEEQEQEAEEEKVQKQKLNSCLGHIWATFIAGNCIKTNGNGHMVNT